MEQHRHLPGPYAQKNKPFKSKHITKGDTKRKNKGRVAGSNVTNPSGSGKTPRPGLKSYDKSRSKDVRRAHLKLARAKTKEDVVYSKKIGAAGPNCPPRVVGLVPISPNTNPHPMYSFLTNQQMNTNPRSPYTFT